MNTYMTDCLIRDFYIHTQQARTAEMVARSGRWPTVVCNAYSSMAVGQHLIARWALDEAIGFASLMDYSKKRGS